MNILYTCFMLGLAACLPVEMIAQELAVDSSVSVRHTHFVIKENKLYLNFDISVNQPGLRSNQGLVLTPELQSSGVIKPLPEVVVNRRNRNISYHRMMKEHRRKASFHEPYAVVKIRKRSQLTIPYQIEIPFEAWMQNANLLLREDILCCRNMTQNISTQTVAQNIGKVQINDLLLTYLSPMLGTSGNQQDSISSILFFPQTMTEVLPGYDRNREYLTKAASVLTDKHLDVTNVHIVGTASPEGSRQLNEQLSKERAHALASFLISHYDVPARVVNEDWIGEDWNSLLKMVEQSDMPYKQEVINIIEKTDLLSDREDRLMKLRSGAPYRYMRTHFFPQLRSASYVIRYKAIPFDVAKGRKLIFSDPRALNADEMLLVANSYPLKSAEYKRVVDVAAKIYPENMMIQINASSAALNEKNTTEAKQYLMRFEQQPESWNNLGIVYLLEGNDELARKYFQKAIDKGDANAVRNMEKLNHP